MPFSVACPNCRTKFKSPDKLAGSLLPCPKCSTPFVVTHPDEGLTIAEEPDLPVEAVSAASEPVGGGEAAAFDRANLPIDPVTTTPASVNPVLSAPKSATADAGVAEVTARNPGLPVPVLIGLTAGMTLLSVACLAGALYWTMSSSNVEHAGNSPSKGNEITQTEPAREASELASGDGLEIVADDLIDQAVIEPTMPSPTDQPDLLEQLKAATVYIQVENGLGVQTGSGFLFEKTGDRGLIVTNSHVISDDDGDVGTVQCVFHSGSRQEFTVTAEVKGKDDGSDLAILYVSHKSLPESIKPAIDISVRETSSVLVLGFPFGEVLATNDHNPAVTVTKGTVSSIRRDEYDNVALVQIDGGINPGNSGGPVMTEEGRLVGISVAKVRDSDIGFAIPHSALSESLRGRVTHVQVNRVRRRAAGDDFRIEIGLIDPKRNLKSTELLTFLGTEQTVKKPDSEGAWTQVADRLLKAEPLEIHSRKQAIAHVTLPPDQADTMFQIRWRRTDGSQSFSPPWKLTDSSGDHAVSRSQIPRGAVTGQRQIVLLPKPMSSFTLRPSTGDIAAVDATDNRLHLFRERMLANGDVTSAPTLQLNASPIQVAYKRFGDSEYYAVVCSNDGHLHLIDANRFELVQKIPIGSVDIRGLAVSTNSEDPFVYYTYGEGHSKATGVVDLRKMLDRGQVFGQSGVCVLSADGRFAYRRDSISSHKFESMQMSSDFSAAKPSFTLLSRVYSNSGDCYFDPLGRYTIAGHSVFSKDLIQRLATLRFAPGSFFTSQPIVVGLRNSELQAVSYNTFEELGQSIVVPAELCGDRTMLASVEVNLIADDRNERIIFPHGNTIGLFPLHEFQVPLEPLMTLQLSAAELRAGTETTVDLSATDPRVKVELGDLPPGATCRDNVINWTPRDEDVGIFELPVTLSFRDTRVAEVVQLSVSQPFEEAPFELAGFDVNLQTKQMVCWTGPTDRPSKRKLPREATGETIAIISLSERPTLVKQVLNRIKQVKIFGSRFAVLSKRDDSQVTIYDANSFERVKTVLAETSLSEMSVQDGMLVLSGFGGAEIYDPNTLEKVRSISSGEGAAIDQPVSVEGLTVKDGVIAGGWLYGADGQRKILLAPGNILKVPGSSQAMERGTFLRGYREALYGGDPHRVGPNVVAGPIPFGSRGLKVSLEVTRSTDPIPRSRSMTRVERRVSLLVASASGELESRVPICVERNILGSESSRNPIMQIRGDTVLVASGERIYRWNLHGDAAAIESNHSAPAAESQEESVAFHLIPEQSTFVLDSEKAVLEHHVKGGQPPYEFVVLGSNSGITYDKTTGTATLDRDQAIRSCYRYLPPFVGGRSESSAEAREHVQLMADKMIDAATPILGHEPTGFPIAFPVRVKAVDSNGDVAEMQYYVLLEAPVSKVVELLQKQLVK